MKIFTGMTAWANYKDNNIMLDVICHALMQGNDTKVWTLGPDYGRPWKRILSNAVCSRDPGSVSY